METNMIATRVIPILGHPVAQVATPALWNAVFAARGQDAVCVPIDLPPAGLPAFFEWVRMADNVPGFLTTVPHKAALAGICDDLGEAAALLGAANTVRKTADGGFAGEMFDGHGMLDAIAQTGAEIAKADVVICGAGAAGSAIGVEVVRRGARHLSILDRDPARAATLARQLADLGGTTVTTGLPQRADVLINASPAGSPGMAPPPFDAPLIAAADCVADALTDPAETALLRQARALGRRVVRGTDMAAAQADRMRQFLGLG